MIDNVNSGWLKTSGNQSIFYNIHIPHKKQIKNLGVIVIGPIGSEYMYCHKTIKCLTKKLSDNGFYAMRYDPIGMGNSTSRLDNNNIFQQWLSSPLELSSFLKKNCQVDDVIFIALRSGALLLSQIMEKQAINYASYWFPYVNGKAWVRDQGVIDSILNSYSNIEGVKDAGGYPLISSAEEAIKKINLNKSDLKETKKILLIEDIEATTNSRLTEQLEKFCELKKLRLEGQRELIQQASLSVVPQLNIECIVEWACSLESKITNKTEILASPYEKLNHESYTEHVEIISEEKSIFGIFCQPESSTYEDILLLVNAGSGHHVGPNRINVDIARSVIEKNVASYRFDLSHLGESMDESDKQSNHPYKKTAADDICLAIDHISKKHQKNIILLGLCSGAHNFFHAALKTDVKDIKQFIIVNPLTFYYQEGQSIFEPDNAGTQIDEVYYNQQATDLNKWLGLIKNPKKILNIIKFIFAFLFGKLKSIQEKLFFRLGKASKNKLDIDFIRLNKKGVKLTFICSDGDPGYQIIKNQAPIFMSQFKNNNSLVIDRIINADHTFSSITSRQLLIAALLKNLDTK